MKTLNWHAMLLSGFLAGFCLQNKRPMHKKYNIFNLDENTVILVDYDLITYSTELMIDMYEVLKNIELKAKKRYKYGIDGQPNGYIKIINYGDNYYLLYEKDQQPLLEKEIFLKNFKMEENSQKNKVIQNLACPFCKEATIFQN